MRTTLSAADVSARLDGLTAENDRYNRRYPGDPPGRQPVHTVYGGAHLFKATTAARLGEKALAALELYGQDPFTFARALDLPGAQALPVAGTGGADTLIAAFGQDADALAADPNTRGAWLACAVHNRVRHKLQTEAVEDFRIDFEDGYGLRPDEEEDATALACAKELAKGMREGTLPSYIGLRIKPLTEAHKARSLRTLDLCLTALLEETGGELPENFVITLPKIQHPGQVEAFVDLLERFEKAAGLAPDALKLELMIELAQNMVDPEGRNPMPALLAAAGARCVGAHFGVYDYTASCGITAAHQGMDHPACDFARSMMQIAFAGTGIRLSDGATHILPVPPHPVGTEEPEQIRENHAVVHQAWRLAYTHTRNSLRAGIYQGWDLHPAQLPVRYAANYAFFLESLDAASTRLRNFIDQATKATLVGDVFDDAATGQGLLNAFARALSCGAITPLEVTATGLTVEEIQGRSFVEIMEARKAKARTA